MENILKLFKDPIFWYALATVGNILINVFSAYLKDWSDQVLSRVSAKRKTSIQLREEEMAVISEFLAENPTLLSVETTIITATENKLHLTAIGLILPAVYILLQPSAEPYGVKRLMLLTALLIALTITTVQDFKLSRFKKTVLVAHEKLRMKNLNETVEKRDKEQIGETKSIPIPVQVPVSFARSQQ